MTWASYVLYAMLAAAVVTVIVMAARHAWIRWGS
jgi:hypothetical protein